MNGHTKGVVDIQRGRGSLEIGFPNGELVELHGSGGSLSLSHTLCTVDFLGEPQQANARRIVALWNAAEELGLTTEAIEAGAIWYLAEGCKVGLSRCRELRDAADEAVSDTGIWGLGNEALADDIDIIDCALAQCRSLTQGDPA